ncbi:hypothetical protein ACN28S_05695 [Cystobacter fuscus]
MEDIPPAWLEDEPSETEREDTLEDEAGAQAVLSPVLAPGSVVGRFYFADGSSVQVRTLLLLTEETSLERAELRVRNAPRGSPRVIIPGRTGAGGATALNSTPLPALPSHSSTPRAMPTGTTLARSSFDRGTGGRGWEPVRASWRPCDERCSRQPSPRRHRKRPSPLSPSSTTCSPSSPRTSDWASSTPSSQALCLPPT